MDLAPGAETGGTDGGVVADSGLDSPSAPRCQAGEACTGNYQCVATRCLRMEQEVCHCINGSLFCGPADCNAPDAGTSDAGASDAGPADAMPRDAGQVPLCATGLQSGDECVSATDRLCATACVAGRTRLCFCNGARDEWVCTQPTRCQAN